MKVVAISNQKGGVGKTTSVVNIGAQLALDGKRVLIIDTDPQSHSSTALNCKKGNGLERLLIGRENYKNIMTEARPNLFLIPNDHTSVKVEESINNTPFREYLLNEVIQEINDIDIVILDTAPSISILSIITLVAADYVIAPARMDYLSLDGVGYLLKTINSLGHYPSVTPPVFIGVLPTFYDRLTKITLTNLIQLQNSIGESLILNPIPNDVKIREASSFGMTIWEYAPNCPAAIGYISTSKVKNSAGRTGGYLHLTEMLSTILF